MVPNLILLIISTLLSLPSVHSFSLNTNTRQCTTFSSAPRSMKSYEGSSTTIKSTSAETTEATTEEVSNDNKDAAVVIDPKEAVKIFGRLADKYIILDPSAGMCCYSGCTDCEYRLPGGGYIMADQSASRPKWIPAYEKRSYNDNEHVTNWSTGIFTDGPAVTKNEFIEHIKQIKYVPPLGGPYVGASGGTIEDDTALGVLFDALIIEGKEKLTKHRMSIQLKELANQEEGLSWPNFSSVF